MIRPHAILGIALALIALAWAFARPALAQESIVFEGQLVNGTPNGGSVEGVAITFHQESTIAHTHLEAVTDSEGRFRFEGVQFDPTAVYGVSARYQDALYGSDIDFSQGSPPPATIKVFDSTNDQEILSGGPASLLFAAADKSSQVVAALEIIRIDNNSNLTYVPATDQPMNLVRFGLPPGSRGLNVDSRLIGADFVQVDRGFALLSSIPPGSHEIMYTYEFPYDETQYTFSKNYRYGAESLRILAPDEALNISSLQFGNTESLTIGERPYRLIQVSDLPRGTEVTVDISELPKASFVDKVGQNLESLRLEYIAPAGLAIVMLALMALALQRRRRMNDRASLRAGDLTATQESQTLLHMIAELEQSFKSGNIDQDDYLRRRRLLETKLISVAGS